VKQKQTVLLRARNCLIQNSLSVDDSIKTAAQPGGQLSQRHSGMRCWGVEYLFLAIKG
jgi:hypothetical protein